MAKRPMKLILTSLVFYLCLTGCKVPMTVYIKENSKHENWLALYTMYKQIDIGVAVIKPFILNFGVAQTVYTISFLNENGNPLWKLKAKKEKTGETWIKYGKLNQNVYDQEFPLDNKVPENLKIGTKYILDFETNKGRYHKEFIYQLSRIYITDSDKKRE